MRIEPLCRERGLAIRWTAFPLHPETPVAGRRLDELFAGRPGLVEAMWQRLQEAGRDLALQFAPRTHTYNSRDACLLAYLAHDRGREWPYHRAVYQAYFGRGENLALEKVLENICTEAGLAWNEAREALRDPDHRTRLERDWQRCRELGVDAVPTLIRGRQRLVGYQPDKLRAFLDDP